MVQMICPVCKNRCELTVDCQGDTITVHGNKCARGDLHAREELNGERKVVTYHAATVLDAVPSIDVKTTGTIPKELTFRLIRLIKKQRIDRPMKRGEVLLHHPLELPVDVVIDSDELEHLEL
jgi:CxxC motif-containing protein